MKIINIAIAHFVLLILTTTIKAQDCYIRLYDESGFETSSFQTDLENAACELIQTFPEEYQNQFKVFDFGFYSIDGYKQGKFQSTWDKILQNIESESPYYLAFGKQSDETGIYTKFWIKLKLPRVWLNQCFDESYITMMETLIVYEINQFDPIDNPSKYADYEKRSMSCLQEKIEELVECCQPELKTTEFCNDCITTGHVQNFFLYHNFDTLGIEVLNPDTSIIEDCLCQTESVLSLKTPKDDNAKDLSSFYDYTYGYLLNINNSIINLTSKSNKFLEIYDGAYGLVTHSVNFCQINFDSLYNVYNNSNIAFWFHVSGDFLYFKSKGIGDKLKIGTCSAQYRDQLECIIDKFESTGANLFTEILNKFDASKKDIIINVDCPPGDGTAQGQTIDELLGRLGILEIYIHPNQFELINDYPFRPPATLIHEACHGLLSLNVLKAGGPTKCTLLNYNYYYASYNSIGATDECIIARHFIDRQTKLLWQYNSKHKKPKYYLSSAWGPYFYSYKDCKSNVNYSQSEMSDWYLEMRDSSPQPFSCFNN